MLTYLSFNNFYSVCSGKEWQGMLQNTKKDSTSFFISKRIIPVFNDNQKIIEFISFSNDITNDKLSEEDPLTYLYNRRAFDKQYKKIASESDIERHPMSIILADIDHFKSIMIVLDIPQVMKF
jgi:GGDEF domain-containing protein